MKRRNIIILILILILISVSLFTYRNIPVFSDDDFIIPDTSKLVSFTISGQNSIKIERIEGNWIVNDELKAHPVAVNNFLYCFTALEVLSIQNDLTEFDDDSCKNIHIDLGKKQMNFKAYIKGKTVYLHHLGAKRIYRIGLKGNQDADLTKLFSDDPFYWQERILINFEPDEIQSIKVFPSKPWESAFSLTRLDSLIYLRNLNDDQIDQIPVKDEKVYMYFSFFNNIYFEEIVSNDTVLQRIQNDNPFFVFEIKPKDSMVRKMDIYHSYTDSGEKDVFHAIVIISGSSLIYQVNYSVLDVLFLDFESFSLN